MKLSLFFLFAFVCGLVSAKPGYVGSDTCGSCHQSEYDAWLKSHHARAMTLPNEQSVEGDFNDTEFRHKDVSSRFFRRDQGYFIALKEGDKASREYQVVYTFGFYPLQQYLLLTEKGHYQAYDVAWDARPESEGGQRWFKLLPEMDTGSGSAFNWSRQLNNWNSRCADCHSTGLKKGFSEKDLSYNTTYAEINVACEACHGPGSEHAALAQADKLSKNESGFSTAFTPALPFHFAPQQSIAQAKDKAAARATQQSQVNACGGCHSRRQPIADADPARDYHDQYRITLLQEPIYHANGDVQDEAFVLGSFMQSKMYQAGVTCSHCHDPHSGQLKLEGNQVCTQCHARDVFDRDEHHKSTPDLVGTQCVDCHMPETVFMGVDARRDHRFSVPQDAHKKVAQEQADFGRLNSEARRANPLLLRDISQYILSPEQPVIRRATLMQLSGAIPSRLTLETIAQLIEDESGRDAALLRRAAVEAGDFLPLEVRWKVFAALLDDPSASVRFSVAAALAPLLPHLPEADAARLDAVLIQYRRQLQYSSDAPSGQAAIAELELARGDGIAAIKALQTALKLEPDYLPAWLNLADIYRSTGQEREEKRCLDQALAIDAENGAVLHAYGLYLVRQKRLGDALDPLRKAAESESGNLQYHYVYAVALESTGRIDHAIDVLQQADQRWPNQYNVLMALVQYLEKSGREAESWAYLSALSAIAPADPAVQQRVQKLKSEQQAN